jgi:predicted Zn finger-like uncharacterized protein
MYVTCPACTARYKTDAQKLRGKTARMRCRACDTVWLVSGPASGQEQEHEQAQEQTLDAPTLDGGAERRASVKRGGERDKRDLFAKRPSDPGVVRQTLRPGPKPEADETFPPPLSGQAGQAGHVAARNETSVLFTLAGLTGAARLKTPEPERTPMAPMHLEEDEGVIDLKALSSTRPADSARPVVMPLFPSEPPPAAFVRDAGSSAHVSASSAPRFGAKQLVAIAGALAAVLLVGLGLRYAFRGEEPAVVSAAPAPPPAAVVAPEPAPEPAPVITASSSADEVKATPATGKKGKPGKGGKAAAGGAKRGARTEAASKPAAPKPAADACGCKGDFNCVLACTVKKGK